MQEKISLYEEVLALEPGSRLFFSLAEMYVAEKMPEKAEAVLRKGVAAHPDYLEARLLLLDVLQGMGKTEEMIRTATPLVQTLCGCSALWTALGKVGGGREGEEAALFRLLGHVREGKPFSWAGVMTAGIAQVCGEGTGPEGEIPARNGVPAAGEDLEAEEIDLAELEEDVKTRTLADLLAHQEEYEQALRIYEQLRDGAGTPGDREFFQTRVDEMRMKMAQEKSGNGNGDVSADGELSKETESGRPADGPQVIDTLTALADRLERRGADEK